MSNTTAARPKRAVAKSKPAKRSPATPVPAERPPATRRSAIPKEETLGSSMPVPTRQECTQSLAAIRDTLYVLGGKWKLPIISALVEGPLRFKELQKTLVDITPKILSKELKELQLNEFVTRTVYATSPVTVEYKLTAYSKTLEKVLLELRDWGFQHRKRLKDCSKARRAADNSK